MQSCVSMKIVDETGVGEIQFGGGGGFTGEVTTYIYKPDGQIYKKDFELNKISQKTTLEFYTEAQSLKGYSYSVPGNMYSFVQIKHKGTVNRIVWAYGSTEVDKRAIELHRKLMALIKK